MSINTNWYIITGAPCSGKTTVIQCLASLGYVTLPEVSRNLIDTEMRKGRTAMEIRANDAKFQKRVFRAKVDAERKILPEQIIFIDGGAIPSSVAYYQVAGLDPTLVIEESKKTKYRKIFFFEQLPFEKDYARVEDEKTASDLNKLLYNTYLELGYNIVRVPLISVEERVKFILNNIND